MRSMDAASTALPTVPGWANVVCSRSPHRAWRFVVGDARRGCPSAAECRAHTYGQPGSLDARVLWQSRHSHTEYRSACARGDAARPVLQLERRLLADPGDALN